MRITDYFDRTFIISLPERTDRRGDMKRELRRVGIDLVPNRVEFFDAIKPSDPAGFASIGTHGCYLSHLELLIRARENGWQNILLMEDDLTFSPRYTRDEPYLVEQLLDSNWGFVYFGNQFNRLTQDPVDFEPWTDHIRGTHFYAVNGWVFDPLIQFLEEVRQRPLGDPRGGSIPIDGALSTFRERNPEIETLMTLPNLGQQRSSRSDISPRWFDSVPVVNRMIGLARRWKVWLKGR
jgi:glycosyl transferase, family 25